MMTIRRWINWKSLDILERFQSTPSKNHMADVPALVIIELSQRTRFYSSACIRGVSLHNKLFCLPLPSVAEPD